MANQLQLALRIQVFGIVKTQKQCGFARPGLSISGFGRYLRPV